VAKATSESTFNKASWDPTVALLLRMDRHPHPSMYQAVSSINLNLSSLNLYLKQQTSH
jgi:hypothetical protein